MAGYNDVYAAKIIDMVATAGVTISVNAHINLVCSARLDREPKRRGCARVKELLARGVHKGRLLPFIASRAPAGALLVAIGDDRTDEDLFAALPPGALAIHVGPEATAAPIRFDGVDDVRALLRAIVDARSG